VVPRCSSDGAALEPNLEGLVESRLSWVVGITAPAKPGCFGKGCGAETIIRCLSEPDPTRRITRRGPARPVHRRPPHRATRDRHRTPQRAAVTDLPRPVDHPNPGAGRSRRPLRDGLNGTWPTPWPSPRRSAGDRTLDDTAHDIVASQLSADRLTRTATADQPPTNREQGRLPLYPHGYRPNQLDRTDKPHLTYEQRAPAPAAVGV
jgi:hypothetical protein